MSGEQWGEAVDAADLNTRVARALWTAHAIHNEVKSNWDELEQPYRTLWLAYAQAAVPLIVADTRRQVAEEAEALRGVIADLVDPDPCWFDHHGGCQAHGYLSLQPGEKCPNAHATELLAEASIARGSGNGDSGQEPEACANGTESHATALTGQPEPSGHNEHRNAHGGPQ